MNTYTTGTQWEPDVAMDSLGDFVVVWSGKQPASSYDIFGQRYDASGIPQGGEFRINEDTAPGGRHSSRVDSDASGNFVVTWIGVAAEHWTVFARRFESDGTPRGGSFVVDTQATDQLRPDVAASSDGAFTISWDTANVGMPAFKILARSFDAEGAPTTAPFLINSDTTPAQQMPSVARDERGGFVIAWQCIEFFSPCLDGAGDGMRARMGGVPRARSLGVDSGGNGVFEPDEQATIAPAWENNFGSDLALASTAASFGGPAGPTYDLADGTADYGTIVEGATADCQTATGDCMIASVSGARPTAHWDATFDETLSTGAAKTWTLHVGESFLDVPVPQRFYAYIEILYHHEITAGCGGGRYCPDEAVSRADVARSC